MIGMVCMLKELWSHERTGKMSELGIPVLFIAYKAYILYHSRPYIYGGNKFVEEK